MIKRAIIGYGGGKSGGGGTARAPVEAPDSLRSRAYARVLDLISEGEIEGLVDGLKSVYLDGVPIQSADGTYNFNGVSIETRDGTQDQAYIAGFSDVESETAVGVEVTYAAPVVRTLSDSDVNAVQVRVSFPALAHTDNRTGDVTGTSVQYAIDVQSYGATGYTEQINTTVTGKASSKYERTHRIGLDGPFPWNIRVRRITADSTSALLSNSMTWESYTEIIEAKLRYPNSALAALSIDSSQFRGIPQRGYHIKGMRVLVPSNYNATTRAYTGVWDGTFTVAYSNNPAWVFYDLVTNTRYGLGNYVDASQVDKWALYSIAQYCDELVDDGDGGTEPRFTCNLYLQQRAEAFKVLSDIASCFRGMIYWAAGAVTAVQDAPADAMALFTAANVVDGLFNYSGSSLKARHTVALVTWNDPDDLYRRKVEYVEDVDGIALYGVVETEVVAVGCTSRAQAHRVGKWLLYSERLESETVAFKTGLDGNLCRPGHVIQIADPNRAGVRRGGRLATGATTTSIPLDNAVTLGGGSYSLLVVEPDGTVQESTITSGAGSHTTLNVSPAFDNAPAAHAIYVVRDTLVEPQTFRVISVVESDPGQFEVTALAHNASKYDAIEQGLALEAPQTTLLNTAPDAPSGLTITEALYEYQAEVRTLVTFSWQRVDRAVSYELWWRLGLGNWTIADNLRTPEYQLQDASAGVYSARLYAVNGTGLKSEVTGYSRLVRGKYAPPSDVVTFTAQQNGQLVLFKWDPVADVDVAGYEIRYSPADVATWDGATPVTRATRGTQITTANVRPGTWVFLIKAVDTSGIPSENATTYTLEVVATDYTQIHEETCAPAWTGWETAGNTLMWNAATSTLMWDQGPPMWSADSAVVQWTNDANAMWSASDPAMWTASHVVKHYTGVLVPQSQTLAADCGWYCFDTFVINPYLDAVYDATEIDQEFDARARVYATISAQLGPGETGAADPTFYVDYRLEAGTFDGFEAWTIGDVTGRYVRPRLALTSASQPCRVSAFTVTMDAAAAATRDTNVAIANGGTAITFTPAYHSAPNLKVSAAADAGAARYATWENLTAAGATVRVFNAAGVDTGGYVNWEATGV